MHRNIQYIGIDATQACCACGGGGTEQEDAVMEKEAEPTEEEATEQEAVATEENGAAAEKAGAPMGEEGDAKEQPSIPDPSHGSPRKVCSVVDLANSISHAHMYYDVGLALIAHKYVILHVSVQRLSLLVHARALCCFSWCMFISTLESGVLNVVGTGARKMSRNFGLKSGRK